MTACVTVSMLTSCISTTDPFRAERCQPFDGQEGRIVAERTADSGHEPGGGGALVTQNAQLLLDREALHAAASLGRPLTGGRRSGCTTAFGVHAHGQTIPERPW